MFYVEDVFSLCVLWLHGYWSLFYNQESCVFRTIVAALRLCGIIAAIERFLVALIYVSKCPKYDTMAQRAERVDYWHGTTPIAHCSLFIARRSLGLLPGHKKRAFGPFQCASALAEVRSLIGD